jgi:uncharacterized protein (DUF488 family)
MNKFFTIGYGGRTPTEFANLLKASGVTLIVDIRLRPHRAYMGIFSKTKSSDKGIEKLLASVGIGYVSLPELGNPFLNDPEWKEKYTKLLEAEGTERTERIRAITEQAFCLLCAEKDFTNCHRLQVAEFLLNSRTKLAEVVHL